MEDEPLDEKSFTLVAIDIPDPVDDPRVMEVQFGKLIEAALPPKSNFVDVQLEPWSQLETDIYVFFFNAYRHGSVRATASKHIALHCERADQDNKTNAIRII